MTDLLAGTDRRDLTAVERFAEAHDRHLVPTVDRYRDRLPAAPPGPGQQYRFEVDLDACTGCKACVAACHSLNGLEDDEAWRKVGTLHRTDGAVAAGRGSITVTSACHHCVEPACLAGCPANAYEKDPVTGIVRHLDDACIGCSYCTLTCPYEVPTFLPSLGIVRKCDLCAGRLAGGEAPACVQGCPQGAIAIGVVEVAVLAAETAAAGPGVALVPTAPDSRLTVPTTAYRSAEPVADDWVAGDRSSLHPAHGHTPLAVMLVLTQVAVGMLATSALLGSLDRIGPDGARLLARVGLVTGLVALAASVLHLGRPLLAWRAVLGLRRSWLSREIVAFGAFATAGTAAWASSALGLPVPVTAAAWSAATTAGLAGVACSARLYAVTGRAWWRTGLTAARFGATATAGGALGTAAVLAVADPSGTAGAIGPLVAIGVGAVAASVVVALAPLHRGARGRDPALAGTARLLGGPLRGRLTARLAAAALAATAALLTLAAAGVAHRALVVVAAVAALAGEHQERRLFFLGSVAPRMPGSPR
jgi:Fe-S-cluster-containing dehydrogenase component/DMSO reductase anchor subunit